MYNVLSWHTTCLTTALGAKAASMHSQHLTSDWDSSEDGGDDSIDDNDVGNENDGVVDDDDDDDDDGIL